ncbi:hypothetical protein MA16_Dca021360 [Dendrobium catenatum]|uniref:Retrovirus-related Pol polyprotein from transposon TNT 1-94-like beta-barrel domain-containing protein n=1 Tax=Dendrobium catenatum TaxID=906689 RepID=A0A2I0X4Y5_9ASPA|nr:hypothetical protein MA16_Dca021360 [Dendrobium catenatum]
MIMSWLWNSMTPEISDTFMFLSTAKDIWDAARQTFSKARDAAQIFEIKIKVGSTKQGSKTVTEYATILKNLWQKLDHYRCIETRCPEDVAIIKNFIKKYRVYDFLAGLNAEFDQVRVQILGKEETPSLNETISLIRAEESRRWIIDSGATDHMTHSPTHLINYTPCPNNKKIITADDSLTTVAGQGDIILSPLLTLKNVLHVPQLSTNLISIQKLINDHNCSALFNPTYCLFQD